MDRGCVVKGSIAVFFSAELHQGLEHKNNTNFFKKNSFTKPLKTHFGAAALLPAGAAAKNEPTVRLYREQQARHGAGAPYYAQAALFVERKKERKKSRAKTLIVGEVHLRAWLSQPWNVEAGLGGYLGGRVCKRPPRNPPSGVATTACPRAEVGPGVDHRRVQQRGGPLGQVLQPDRPHPGLRAAPAGPGIPAGGSPPATLSAPEPKDPRTGEIKP